MESMKLKLNFWRGGRFKPKSFLGGVRHRANLSLFYGTNTKSITQHCPTAFPEVLGGGYFLVQIKGLDCAFQLFSSPIKRLDGGGREGVLFSLRSLHYSAASGLSASPRDVTVLTTLDAFIQLTCHFIIFLAGKIYLSALSLFILKSCKRSHHNCRLAVHCLIQLFHWSIQAQTQ